MSLRSKNADPYSFVLFAICLTAGLFIDQPVLAESVQAYKAEVRLDLSSRLQIRLGSFEKSVLDRNIYFRCYHMPGLFSDELSRELIEIGAIPGRGTGPYYAFDKRHSYDYGETSPIDITDFRELVRQQNQRYIDMYQKAAIRYPGIPHALASNSYYPESMRMVDENGKTYALLPDKYSQYSDLIVAFYDDLKENHCSIPLWYTSQNEPSWQWGAEEFSKYTRTMAEKMDAAHPNVKICGPCSAWPYPRADWKRWGEWEKRFIEITGDQIGAYDLHFYSKGYWAYIGDNLGGTADSKKQDTPSLFESRKRGNEYVWDYGRLDAFLDLFAAYHSRYWRTEPKPVIISEFGRQGIHPQLGPWENEFKPWLYMTTVVRMWMTFMERPEVELAVPFILGEPGITYGAQRGQTIYTRHGVPDDPTPKVTRFRDFYAFFRDLKGTRLAYHVPGSATTDSQYLSVRPFIEGDSVYILLHNSKGYPDHRAVVNLAPTVEEFAGPLKIINKQIKRLRWEGPVPLQHDAKNLEGRLRIDTEYATLESISDIKLEGEETCIVKLQLSAVPKQNRKIVETVNYSTDTLIDIEQGKTHTLNIYIPKYVGKKIYAKLYLALARDGGFESNPLIKINDAFIKDFDVTGSSGVAAFHAPVEVTIPVSALVDGENSISVKFADDISQGWPKIVTAKIIVGWQN